MKPHPFLDALAAIDTALPYGHVDELGAGVVRATGPAASLGDLCEISVPDGTPAIAEVVAVSEHGVTLIPLEGEVGLTLGARVTTAGRRLGIPRGDGFAGRAIDALGRPIDGKGALRDVTRAGGAPVAALDRINPDGRVSP